MIVLGRHHVQRLTKVAWLPTLINSFSRLIRPKQVGVCQTNITDAYSIWTHLLLSVDKVTKAGKTRFIIEVLSRFLIIVYNKNEKSLTCVGL